MSNSNMFQGELNKTTFADAYKFESFSSYITNNGLSVRGFLPNCIFCSSTNTANLAKDGSFKQCKTCNKQFKSMFDTGKKN